MKNYDPDIVGDYDKYLFSKQKRAVGKQWLGQYSQRPAQAQLDNFFREAMQIPTLSKKLMSTSPASCKKES